LQSHDDDHHHHHHTHVHDDERDDGDDDGGGNNNGSMGSTSTSNGGGGTGGDDGGGLDTPPQVNALPSQPQTPPGTKRLIIWDTNAYRNFVGSDTVADARAKALHLRKCEQASGVLALASPIVIWELPAHVADSSDPHVRPC